MVTVEHLEKRIEKVNERLATALQESETTPDPEKIRKIRKRLKRTQRKLRKMKAHEQKVSASAKGKKDEETAA